MEKRYQVFVSSTYADLKDERQRVTQALMEMDCIPAGMELFPAVDEEQWQFIKKVIEDCDYYILIIGGRYGSLTSDGISYTEKEYNYAISVGLKVLAFVHERPDDIPLGKSDTEADLRAKLTSFREKVAADRLGKFWTNAAELPGMVALSLSKTIKLYPAVGWIRARNIASKEILADLNDLRKENDSLRSKVRQLESLSAPEHLNLAGLNEIVNVELQWQSNDKYRISKRETIAVTWSSIFSIIGPSLIEHPTDDTANRIIAKRLYNQQHPGFSEPNHLQIVGENFETIRLQLSTHGLIDAKFSKSTAGRMALFWSITNKGQRELLALRTVRSGGTT